MSVKIVIFQPYNQSLYKKVAQEIDSSYFLTGKYREIYKIMSEHIEDMYNNIKDAEFENNIQGAFFESEELIYGYGEILYRLLAQKGATGSEEQYCQVQTVTLPSVDLPRQVGGKAPREMSTRGAKQGVFLHLVSLHNVDSYAPPNL